MSRTKNKPEDVWKHMDIKGKDECWEWMGYKHNGYGQVRINKKNYFTHRLIYELIYECTILKNIYVCHKCDNPSCCNPKHLFLGTNQDNMDDMVSKNRQTHGENQWKHKLNQTEVNNIRELYSTGNYTQVELGLKFNINHQNISWITTNKTWLK